MFKPHTFAVIVLFWVAMSASLMQVQLRLVASPVYKMRTATYHSMPIRTAVIAQAQATSATINYNKLWPRLK